MLGKQIGPYEVISQLGEGGMGAVYLARHMTLGRQVAVKILLPEFSNNRDVVARFFNEARAATAIRYAGIVEVYDFGFLEDQQAYIIMEYLEGESLGTRLRRGPLPIAPALVIVRGIARSLQAAHEKGIVHRDLKPDNIFLVPDEDARGGERIKLLDFGIAKLTQNTNEPAQTRTGMLIGTPTYMAPEQCRGDAVDLRADLYALGCVIYHMLCGRPPFVAVSSADVLARHLYFEPQRPSVLRPDIPPHVEQLVMSLLTKDPAHRPAAASAIVQLVDSFTTDTPPFGLPVRPSMQPAPAVPAVPPGPVPEPQTTLSGAASIVTARWPRHRRSLVIAGTALVTAAVAGVVIIATRSNSAEPSSAAARGDTPAAEDAPPSPTTVAAEDPPAPAPRPRERVETAPADASVLAGDDASTPAAAAHVAPASVAATPAKGDSRAVAERRKRRDDGAGSAARTAPSPSPAKDKQSTTSQTGEAAPPAPPSPSPECTSAVFQPILKDPAPQQAAVQAALAKLNACRSSLSSDTFSQIQRQLILKL
jgi:serine/threonine-protein kinase